MAATYKDMDTLRTDNTFQGRVRAAMISGGITIGNEAWSVPFHRERASFVSSILNNIDNYAPLFASAVATDSTVISDATQAGTVAVTGANVATQQALVTDAHILSALGNVFNAFFRVPQ